MRNSNAVLQKHIILGLGTTLLESGIQIVPHPSHLLIPLRTTHVTFYW
uniref:Uncharacterized protein n=1 Tax=Anguilla anguilla TaxID=7936 RepID=A0A0E9SPC5_ANGAN